MKKKALSLALALAMCLGLTTPAFAAAKVGDTTITDANGTVYKLSNPILGTEPLEEYMIADGTIGEAIVYLVPLGTNIMPVMPEGFSLGADSQYGMLIYEKGDHNINFMDGLGWYGDGGYGSMGLEGTDVMVQSVLLIQSRYYKGSWDDAPESALYFKGVDTPGQTDPVDPSTDPEPVTPPAKSEIAMPTNDKLTVNGKPAAPTVYKIDGANYFKIRDVAALLNGTEKQFSVGYDGALKSVTATTGQGYEKLDTDLVGAPAGGNKTADPSNDTIYVNGEKIDAQVYKIDGGNYFKLRDLGKALNFSVDWSKEQGMMIDTGKPYTE